jgi:hypothetical protein
LNPNQRILTWTPSSRQNFTHPLRRCQVHAIHPDFTTLPGNHVVPLLLHRRDHAVTSQPPPTPSLSPPRPGTTPSAQPSMPLAPRLPTVTAMLGNRTVLPAITITGSTPPSLHHHTQELRCSPSHHHRWVHAAQPSLPAGPRCLAITAAQSTSPRPLPPIVVRQTFPFCKFRFAMFGCLPI